MAHVPVTERRPQLIRAAIDLMTREGVAAASTRAIAAELGVAQATVHYTFGNKEELYHAVMQQLTEQLVAQVEQAAPQDPDFDRALGTLASALWQTVREQPTSHQLLSELTMYALRTPRLGTVVQDHYTGVLAVTSRLIEEAAARADRQLAQPADTIARFFHAGFDGLTVQHLVHPDEAAEAACLRALVAATAALAAGELTVPAGGAPTP